MAGARGWEVNDAALNNLTDLAREYAAMKVALERIAAMWDGTHMGDTDEYRIAREALAKVTPPPTKLLLCDGTCAQCGDGACALEKHHRARSLGQPYESAHLCVGCF